MLLLQQLLLLRIVVYGNSATATKLATARNIALAGAVKGNVNFDGSGNVTITTTQNNIFVLTGTVSLSNGSGSTAINYPSGLNKDNCIPFMSGLNTSGTYYDYGNIQSSCVTGVRLTDTDLRFNCGCPSGVGPTGTKSFRIVLMKTN